MKKQFLLSLIFLSCVISVNAQNDTMYFMKDGFVINIQSVNPDDMDSIIFYKPPTAASTVVDEDGNVYQTVIIGTQTWMAENLKTTKYNNGNSIPLVSDNAVWSSIVTPGYCWQENDQATYGDTYGALYNWYAVNTGNLCPTDWHVATDDDWVTLIDYLGGESVASDKLKEPDLWFGTNAGATNESGFTARPGGNRSSSGSFVGVTEGGLWWSSTEYDSGNAWSQGTTYNYSGMDRFQTTKKNGFSVRCIKD